MTETTDWNARPIEEFARTGGQVGGNFAAHVAAPAHDRGALRPGAHQPDDVQDLGAAASRVRLQPACRQPGLVPQPRRPPGGRREIGTETGANRGPPAAATNGTHLVQAKGDYPGFADYEAKTDREIPVVIPRTDLIRPGRARWGLPRHRRRLGGFSAQVARRARMRARSSRCRNTS